MLPQDAARKVVVKRDQQPRLLGSAYRPRGSSEVRKGATSFRVQLTCGSADGAKGTQLMGKIL